MPTLYDLPSLLDQNTEDISFSVHFRFVAVPFQMAVSTFVFRSWLCEGITVPTVAWKLFAVAISHHSIVLMRSAAVRFGACGSESIHAASRWNLAQKPCANLSARLQLCKVRNGEGEEKARRSAGRKTNGEIGTYARLAANFDISIMGTDDRFDYAQAETETRL